MRPLLEIREIVSREIGGILGISEEAVRKRVARGSQDFRNEYDLELGGDEE